MPGQPPLPHLNLVQPFFCSKLNVFSTHPERWEVLDWHCSLIGGQTFHGHNGCQETTYQW